MKSFVTIATAFALASAGHTGGDFTCETTAECKDPEYLAEINEHYDLSSNFAKCVTETGMSGGVAYETKTCQTWVYCGKSESDYGVEPTDTDYWTFTCPDDPVEDASSKLSFGISATLLALMASM